MTIPELRWCLRACLHEGRGPQVGEVTCGWLPHLTGKRDHIKMRDYMDRRVTLPIWGPHLHVNRPLQRFPSTTQANSQLCFK